MARQTRRKTAERMRRERLIVFRILALVLLVLLACAPLYFLNASSAGDTEPANAPYILDVTNGS